MSDSQRDLRRRLRRINRMLTQRAEEIEQRARKEMNLWLVVMGVVVVTLCVFMVGAFVFLRD